MIELIILCIIGISSGGVVGYYLSKQCIPKKNPKIFNFTNSKDSVALHKARFYNYNY